MAAFTVGANLADGLQAFCCAGLQPRLLEVERWWRLAAELMALAPTAPAHNGSVALRCSAAPVRGGGCIHAATRSGPHTAGATANGDGGRRHFFCYWQQSSEHEKEGGAGGGGRGCASRGRMMLPTRRCSRPCLARAPYDGARRRARRAAQPASRGGGWWWPSNMMNATSHRLQVARMALPLLHARRRAAGAAHPTTSTQGQLQSSPRPCALQPVTHASLLLISLLLRLLAAAADSAPSAPQSYFRRRRIWRPLLLRPPPCGGPPWRARLCAPLPPHRRRVVHTAVRRQQRGSNVEKSTGALGGKDHERGLAVAPRGRFHWAAPAAGARWRVWPQGRRAAACCRTPC